MKKKNIICLFIITFGLFLVPMLSSSYGTATQETWGVTTDDDYYYTFGIDGEVLLPDLLWDHLSGEFAEEGLDDMFNNSYEVGYADGYEKAYDDGFDNISNGIEDPYNYTRIYDGDWDWDSYEEGLENGYNNGYPDGYMDLWEGFTRRDETGHYWQYNEHYKDYIDEEVFMGFPQSEKDAVDLKTIYQAFLDMDKIFNMHIHVDSMNEMIFQRDSDPNEYYYDVINLTAQFKVASSGTYLPVENFTVSYLENEVLTMLNTAFAGTGTILTNFTAKVDELITGINNAIAEGSHVLENQGFIWGTGQNITLKEDELPLPLIMDVLGNFGFDFETRRTWEWGWSQGYENGYYAGFWGEGYWVDDDSSKIDGYSDGYENGYYDGQDDWNYDDQTWHGEFYDNPNIDAPEYRDEAEMVQEGPEGYGRLPLFIPSDLDVGAQIELLKDAANINLAQNHAIIMGGFNGIVEQMGLDFITNEKQIYIAGDIKDPKWMFGSILDLGGMVLLDQLNLEFDSIPLDINIQNDSLAADAVFNIEWDANGNLLNFHAGLHYGLIYDPTNIMGLNLEFDLSKGAQTELNAEYTEGELPTQKYYPTTVNGNWGIDEGDVTDFTTSFDINLEMPNSMWDELSDEMWIGMNETYYMWTNGTKLPTSETVDAELIFETMFAEIPNVINLQSKVTDMLGIEESWVDENGTHTHEYDFYAQYLLAKTPDENNYQPVGMLIDDFYNGFFDAVGDSLPPSFAAELQEQAEGGIIDMLTESMIEGTSVSILEIVQQFVPTTLHSGESMLPDLIIQHLQVKWVL